MTLLPTDIYPNTDIIIDNSVIFEKENGIIKKIAESNFSFLQTSYNLSLIRIMAILFDKQLQSYFTEQFCLLIYKLIKKEIFT